MNVLQREYIGLIVIAVQIEELIVAFRSVGRRTVSVEHATLAFPMFKISRWFEAEQPNPSYMDSPSTARG
jgi:hypothetical protein